MTGEIVNLRQRRKRAGREAARKSGDANAARHGRSKAEKQLLEARSAKAERQLDAHRRVGRDGTDEAET
jgi:hypothetical protein